MADADHAALIGQVAADQARASDPDVTAWVSANAGSGKTHVLTQRVIRLLLEGHRPSAILCLTYTKAAAAEMSNRVFARLAEWTRLDDDALAGRIETIESRRPGPGRLIVARQLFARALETPGGLKIQTIHAFCEAVLHQFPLEANVPGHFEILDDVAANVLLADARRTLLTAALAEEDRPLAAAFQYVLEQGGEFGLENLLAAIVANREPIRRFTAFAESQGGVEAVLRGALGLASADDADAITARAWPLPSLSGEALTEYCAAADGQTAATARKFAAALRTIDTAPAGDRWPHIRQAFLKKDGAARSLGNAAPKGVAAAMPDAAERIAAAQDHVLACVDHLARLGVFEATRAALVLAARLGHDYERLKRQRGRLDFDDLVARTAALLERDGAGPWVHYKLDQGIDHILVDEAQDTSPSQWSVIRALSEDFFAGESARDARRTLFVVGDEKQSIYSFQGARPERFDEERRSVAKRVGDAGQRFEPVRLNVSFRSTAEVLAAVDHVFADADARRGLGTEPAIVHETTRIRQPGTVDVWAMIHKDKGEESEDWTAPFDAVAESAPPARLARRVAATIRDWIGRETIAEDGKARRIRPGDVLVLVRKRDAFVQALTRELKQRADIPVAGTDRLKLADHIAVQDLVALGQVMLLPEDDLALAALLKSPLFAVSEDDLYALAAERGEHETVFDRLASLAGGGGKPWTAIHARLAGWRTLVDRLPVFEFYARVLGDGGRRQMLARLGHEASDVLDEFLSFALEHEQVAGLPGMQAFLATMQTDSPEIKREMEKGRDEVRIMTVHASKGLEAPVVFLVDPGGDAVHASHVPALRALPLDPTGASLPPAVLWVPGKAFENTITEGVKAGLRQAGEEEYRRLLYVGMTRAADRLVVCGYQTPDDPKYSFWQGMVWGALANVGSVESRTWAVDGEEWEGLHFRIGAAPGPAGDAGASEARPFRPLPATLKAPLAIAPRLPRPLSPSGASAIIDGGEPEPPTGSPLLGAGTGNTTALERGRIVHRFLQVLPGLPVEERKAAAERYLQRACAGWSGEETARIADSVFAVFGDPAFAPVFSPGSQAEVSVMGTLRLGTKDHAVSGRIDRLVVDRERVLIVDYKTNRPPVFSVGAVPPAYKAQLAIYRAVLAPLYPGKSIEAALLFTEAPVLVPIGASELDAALAALAPS